MNDTKYSVSPAQPSGTGFFICGPGDIIFHLNTTIEMAEWIASKLDIAFEAGRRWNDD